MTPTSRRPKSPPARCPPRARSMHGPMPTPDLRVPVREIVLYRSGRRAAGAGLRHHRALYRSRRDHRRRAGACPRPHRLGARARRRRGISRGGRSSRSTTATSPASTSPAPSRPFTGRCARLPPFPPPQAGRDRQADHPARMGPRRRHHQGNGLHRRARESRPQAATRTRARQRSPTARASAPACRPS